MNEIVQFVLTGKDATGAAFASARAGLNQLGAQVISVRGLMATLTAAFSVGAFSAGVKEAAAAGDAAAKMGDRFGIATDKLIGMQHAGALAGATSQGLANGLKNIAAIAIDAARGGEESARAFGILGINAREFIRLPMDRQLEIVIDKLGQVENATLRNEVANKVLGKNYGELMGLVAEGSESFRRAAEDARAWGLAIDRVDAAKLEMANDAISRAMAAARGLFTTIAVRVAPIVEYLASLWADNARETNGFRIQVDAAITKVIVGVAHAINVVRGLEFAWVNLKLIIAGVVDLAMQGIAKMVETMASSKFLEFAQRIPGPIGLAAIAMRGFALATKEGLGEVARWTEQNAAEILKQLDALAERGLVKPEELLAKFRAISAAMQKEAEKLAAQRERLRVGGGDLEVPQDKGKKDDNRWQQDLAQRVARIQIENQTELELLQQQLTEKQIVLDLAAQQGLISDEVWQAQSAIIFANYEAAKTKVHDDELKKRYGISQVFRTLDMQSAGYFLNQMSAMMQSKSRTMFEVGKAAAIGETIINTYRAAQGAYAALAQIPFIGPALGIAAAAAAIVAGMARVQQIRSTNFGGGGGATATFSANPVTGVPEAPINPLQAPQGGPGQPQPQPTQTLIVSGLRPDDIISGASARTMAEKLLEFERMGGRVKFEGT